VKRQFRIAESGSNRPMMGLEGIPLDHAQIRMLPWSVPPAKLGVGEKAQATRMGETYWLIRLEDRE
jgi:hypothetical protein